MLKNRWVAGAAIAAVALGALAADAQAGTITLQAGNFQSGSGGEFKVTQLSETLSIAPSATMLQGTGGAIFQTFCLEFGENLAFGRPYTYVVNTGAVAGGDDPFGTPAGGFDPLGEATAKLFYAFYSGQLANYNFADVAGGDSRKTDAGQLQNAIWYLEGELASVSGDALAFVNYATAPTTTWASLGQASWTGIGQVRVLNLYERTGLRQDVLGIHLVPLPPAALAGLGLLGGLGLLRLRRRRSV